jgi:hypothetical protein
VQCAGAHQNEWVVEQWPPLLLAAMHPCFSGPIARTYARVHASIVLLRAPRTYCQIPDWTFGVLSVPFGAQRNLRFLDAAVLPRSPQRHMDEPHCLSTTGSFTHATCARTNGGRRDLCGARKPDFWTAWRIATLLFVPACSKPLCKTKLAKLSARMLHACELFEPGCSKLQNDSRV